MEELIKKEDEIKISDLNIIKETPSYKFSIQVGSSDGEFFTVEKPLLNDNSIIINHFFFKGIISKEVRGIIVEEFYPEAGQQESITFMLEDGILLKKVADIDNPWFDNTKFMAEQKVKDKVISEYEKAIPMLENKMIAIEEQLKRQHNNSNNLIAI